MSTEALDYIARCTKCGKINQAIAGYLAQSIARIIRDGGSVERMATEEIRKPENWCNCGSVTHHTHKLVQDASPERIAACLEACDGIATESLTGAIAKRLTWATEAEEVLVQVLDSLEQAAAVSLEHYPDDEFETEEEEQIVAGVWRAIYYLKKFGVMNTLQAAASQAAGEAK